MGMCTEEATRRIFIEQFAIHDKAKKLTFVDKGVIVAIILAIIGVISFNATSLYEMKDTINNVANDISKTQLVNKNDLLNVIASNTAAIVQIQNWQINYAGLDKARLEKIELEISYNTKAVEDIVKNKADNRWRYDDEMKENEKKEIQRQADLKSADLTYQSFRREDQHIMQTVLEKFSLLDMRLMKHEEDFDDWIEDHLERTEILDFSKDK